MSAPKLVALSPVEKARIYTYPNGQAIRIDGPITHLAVSASGNHRLIAGRVIHIVAPGWVHIAIGAEAFTV